VSCELLAVHARLVLHQIGKSAGERVDLVVERLVVATLGVLEQRDQQKGQHRGHGVDHELPRVDALEQRNRGHPHHDHDQTDREERTPTDESRGPLGEVVEERGLRLAWNPDLSA
jgi:hypothetical protein